MPAEYERTDAQRSLVENAAAFGLTQADIAEQLASARRHCASISGTRAGIPAMAD